MNNIEFFTPQFTRVDGIKPSIPEDFRSLDKLPDETLKQIGCQVWDDTPDGVIWLFPHEWYNYIPDDLEIIDIFGNVEKFIKGKTDNDIRFGALSFGFIKAKDN